MRQSRNTKTRTMVAPWPISSPNKVIVTWSVRMSPGSNVEREWKLRCGHRSGAWLRLGINDANWNGAAPTHASHFVTNSKWKETLKALRFHHIASRRHSTWLLPHAPEHPGNAHAQPDNTGAHWNHPSSFIVGHPASPKRRDKAGTHDGSHQPRFAPMLDLISVQCQSRLSLLCAAPGLFPLLLLKNKQNQRHADIPNPNPSLWRTFSLSLDFSYTTNLRC
ncbi:hypothetical protein GE09DRAFT_256254 [Coniochaeta sp. 2T2.1]|nr:hypothetical protein GE09DRAFT_256254 [Coniochaeta sp. 2T2.1]